MQKERLRFQGCLGTFFLKKKQVAYLFSLVFFLVLPFALTVSGPGPDPRYATH